MCYLFGGCPIKNTVTYFWDGSSLLYELYLPYDISACISKRKENNLGFCKVLAIIFNKF